MLMDVEQPNIRLGSFIWIKKDLEVRSTHARTWPRTVWSFHIKGTPKGVKNGEHWIFAWSYQTTCLGCVWVSLGEMTIGWIPLYGHRWPFFFLRSRPQASHERKKQTFSFSSFPQIQKASKNHHPFLPNLELDHLPPISIHHSTIPRPTLIATLAASVQRSAWLMVSGTYLSLMGFRRPTATSGSPALAPKVPSPQKTLREVGNLFME